MAPKCFGICLDCWAEVREMFAFVCHPSTSFKQQGLSGILEKIPKQHVMKYKTDFPINIANKQYQEPIAGV
jgi:hypothetical protein